jgi:hypothetical protein
MAFNGRAIMGIRHDNPNVLPSTGSQSRKGKRRVLGCGVGLLAVLSAAALLAAFVERVLDSADRAT